MLAPSEQAALPVYFFDGKTSARRKVELDLGLSLGIGEDGGLVQCWAYDTIRRVDGPPGMLRLRSLTAEPLARLEVVDQTLAQQIIALCAQLDADEPQGGQTGKIVGWSLAAIASIVLSVLFIIPHVADWATPYIPRSFDRWLGQVAESEVKLIFDGQTCGAPEGKIALNKLLSTLSAAGGLDDNIEASVIVSTIPNAFALPGGRVLILSALLARADNVDELAGVLAHELGHVAHRDQVRAMLHDGGSAFLIGLLFGDIGGGGAILVATRSLFESAYSRDVEAQADRFAFEVMHRLGRPAKPLGEFLVRLTESSITSPGSLFDSHPVSEERLRHLAEDDTPPSAPPLLGKDEWRALKRICDGR